MIHFFRTGILTSSFVITAMFATLPVIADETTHASVSVPNTIKGEIIDKENWPVPQATIKIDGTDQGTTTDIDGKFEITNLPQDAKSITISYVGMATKTYSIDQVPEKIVMENDTKTLNEVVIRECSDNTLAKLHAKAAKYSPSKEKCIPTECINNDYTLVSKYQKDSNNQFELDDNGEKILIDSECVINKCNDPRYKLIDGECIDQVGKDCTTQIQHAVTASYQMVDGKLKCVVTQCDEPGWVRNAQNTKCEASDGPCTDAQIKAVAHATAGNLRKGKCIITECGYGYHPSDDGSKCDAAKLSKEGSEKQIADLKDNAQKMKDKEKSFENRMLGGAAIGATGIGAMNLASGLAEQKADNSAEEDMRAYLATFVCDYGRGRNIKGGERGIELPGGNNLISAVTEYKKLAADLKVRKEALGKQPGIESEVIYDAAETGLYDNVGAGRQSGAYASLSRALMDENSEDAARWNEQKSNTASKIKTGAIVAGIGAIGGLVGNLAINSGEKNKNQVYDIMNNREYEKKRQEIRKELKPIEDNSRQEADQTPQETEVDKEEETTPPTPAPQPEPETEPVSEPKPEPQTKPIVTLYNNSLFDSGKYQLKDTAKQTLNNVISTLKGKIDSEDKFKIILAAHTDRDKVKTNSPLCRTNKVCNNEQLAQKRGDSVKDYLTQNSGNSFTNDNITVMAIGEKCATATTAAGKAQERKVDFYILFGDEQLSAEHNYCDTNTPATPSGGGGTNP